MKIKFNNKSLSSGCVMLAERLLQAKRLRDDKETDWKVMSGFKSLAKHEDKSLSDMLHIMNCSLYVAGVPLDGRKAMIAFVKEEYDILVGNAPLQ